MSILSSRPRSASRRGPGHGHGVSISSALLKAVLVGAVIVVPAVEAGSWFITKLQLEDDAAGAAVVAADSVDRDAIEPQTARTAFAVAREDLAQRRGGEIEPASFRLFEDGTVRFTAHRSAPSPLLGHLDWTRDLMQVSAEVEGSPVE